MAAKKKKLVSLVPQPDPRAPLDGAAFLASAQRVLATLRDDLLQRADQSAGVTEALRAEWQKETAEKRTGDAFELWRSRVVIQVAAAWVLSVVFARTLEDRGLLDRNRIAGPGATDSQRQFLDLAPYLTERDYLLTVFRELSNLPAARDLFDADHNPVWKLAPSADGARTLLELFRTPDAEAPSFRFGQSDTRFLGDLYQDIDQETRERYALLQTPRFVEEFILDQTLEPALREFGLDTTTILDPTCGSGHFLLGAFERLVDHRLRERPGTDVRDAARSALDAVHGVDINPYAVAIARFRLTLAFLERGGYAKLLSAPAVPLNVVVADSLLHGRGSTGQATFAERPQTAARDWLGSTYAFVNERAAKEVLGKQYAAVVGNPPYITVKDTVLRDEYRKLYRSCYREYSLAAPFTERFFDLARTGGFAGMITANSFMKREFGKKLIEEYLTTVDLQLIVNTSGAYIPGHGTPTVLLFGRNRGSEKANVLAVLAKRGEPNTPDQPEHGLVWRSIADHFAQIGFENDYISIAELKRTTLANHPWSLGGGGAAELKHFLEARASSRLGDVVDAIGFGCITRADDVYFAPRHVLRNAGIPDRFIIENVEGEVIRDWSIINPSTTVFPYNNHLDPVRPEEAPAVHRFLWPYRTLLWLRREPNGNHREIGLTWWEWSRFQRDRFRRRLSIAFAFVATHNHFVLDRGGKVFKQSAPIIKLREGATEEDHLALLAYLNSSTACFWLKQAMMNKGGSGIGRGVQDEAWEARFEFDGSKLSTIPLPATGVSLARLAAVLQQVSADRESCMGAAAISAWSSPGVAPIGILETQSALHLARMCALQEELDWMVYDLFGLLTGEDRALLRQARDEALPGFPTQIPASTATVRRHGLFPGHRPFEIVLARESALAGTKTAWFERNGCATPADVGTSYAPSYLRLLEARVAIIDRNLSIRLIEQPEYKRRWTLRNWSQEFQTAANQALLSAAEGAVVANATVLNIRDISSTVTSDQRLRDIADSVLPAWHDFASGVGELVAGASVPFLAALRKTAPGLEKRAAWEHTWSLQRREDAGEDVGPIPVPPKYGQEDFRDPVSWRLRGKLDVPKERFISYPGCESDEDHSPVYGWAGWNHLQQAQALATLYQKRKTEEAWGKDRLVPMLAGIDELVPWV
ncbi:MAG: BREX-2 system adenine-specific DNA-methyltransferase PglX, partial [Polyangiaceae bacterium]